MIPLLFYPSYLYSDSFPSTYAYPMDGVNPRYERMLLKLFCCCYGYFLSVSDIYNAILVLLLKLGVPVVLFLSASRVACKTSFVKF